MHEISINRLIPPNCTTIDHCCQLSGSLTQIVHIAYCLPNYLEVADDCGRGLYRFPAFFTREPEAKTNVVERLGAVYLCALKVIPERPIFHIQFYSTIELPRQRCIEQNGLGRPSLPSSQVNNLDRGRILALCYNQTGTATNPNCKKSHDPQALKSCAWPPCCAEKAKISCFKRV